ncbi:twin-arginine translocation signal domain-containing protein [Haloterrigena salifodinae]|uniref:Twin-arginine translocation signal domain-containing protein n=1 Tax=Haloterrigena salifodinae TaxID=2675099 RepID=A0A8T8DXY7_9EURY|nr:twin-arginine translocation signal domain-containing protein [Haloterrigena salifodinae]QRV14414.1 twin-arginine translocation signal domain-containing protein [Haloterrigena salifodinae]
MSEDITRRNFLRTSSAGAAAVGLGGLAGCTSSLPFVGDGGASSANVDSWLVDPSFTDLFQDDELANDYQSAELQSNEQRNRTFNGVVPQAIFDNEEELITYWPLQQGSDRRSRVGVSASDLDWQLSQRVNYEFTYSYSTGYSDRERTKRQSLTVVTFAGSFDPATIEENLNDWADDQFPEDSDNGLESAGEREGFDLYETDGRAFGVSDEYVVEADGDGYLDATAALEAAIDAHANADGRWSETDDGETLLSSFDNGHMDDSTVHESAESRLKTQLGLPSDTDLGDLSDEELANRKKASDFGDWEEGLVGTATAHEFDGDSTDLRKVYLYESEGAADADTLDDYVDSNRDIGDEFATLEDYSIDTDGRTLLLTGTVRTRALIM